MLWNFDLKTVSFLTDQWQLTSWSLPHSHMMLTPHVLTADVHRFWHGIAISNTAAPSAAQLRYKKVKTPLISVACVVGVAIYIYCLHYLGGFLIQWWVEYPGCHEALYFHSTHGGDSYVCTVVKAAHIYANRPSNHLHSLTHHLSWTVVHVFGVGEPTYCPLIRLAVSAWSNWHRECSHGFTVVFLQWPDSRFIMLADLWHGEEFIYYLRNN